MFNYPPAPALFSSGLAISGPAASRPGRRHVGAWVERAGPLPLSPGPRPGSRKRFTAAPRAPQPPPTPPPVLSSRCPETSFPPPASASGQGGLAPAGPRRRGASRQPPPLPRGERGGAGHAAAAAAAPQRTVLAKLLHFLTDASIHQN
ncbi:unnamed protein product [Natator depressus]